MPLKARPACSGGTPTCWAAAIAASAKSVVIMLKGATNMAPVLLEIELTAWDNQDSVRGGLTALPNAAAAASGGLLISGSNAGTTTLAALVQEINLHRGDHIITLEEPIEYLIPSAGCQVTQREVHTHTKSFAAALRGALREDPDIIMVGEMRDLETIQLAISASETLPSSLARCPMTEKVVS